MRYMLDTDICSYTLHGGSDKLEARFLQQLPGDLCISSITLAELQFGVAKSARVEMNQAALDGFIATLVIAPFGAEAARRYGDLRFELQSRGTPIGGLDTLIAAHALSLNSTLVTNNEREFRRVPGLTVENWLK